MGLCLASALNIRVYVQLFSDKCSYQDFVKCKVIKKTKKIRPVIKDNPLLRNEHVEESFTAGGVLMMLVSNCETA